MKITLKLRMILWIWGITALLLFLLLYVYFDYSKHYVREDIIENASLLTRYYDGKFQAKFAKAALIPRMTADSMENFSPGQEKDIENYLKNIIKKEKTIFGSAIAFEPYLFSKNKEFFAPYCYNSAGEIIFLDLSLNKSYDYLHQIWYSVPKKTLSPCWSEPYFDKGGGDAVMITYSVPFYKSGVFAGITTVDISLESLTKEMNREKILTSGYAFMVNKRGYYLSFPDQKKILRGNIFTVNKDLALGMASGKSGSIETFDPLRREKCWVIYEPVDYTDFCLGFVYPQKEILGQIYDLETKTFVLGVLGLLLLLLVIILISNSITKPVANLAEGVLNIAGGNLKEKISVDSSTVEVAALGESINKMMDDLNNYIEKVRSITVEKERIASELALARDIQLSACPSNFPPFPDKNVDIYAKMIPAREVGGDFYDFFTLDEKRICFVIGDASGKGIPAAMFVTRSMAYLKSVALKGYSPSECLENVNRLLCEENDLTMFITMFYGILNIDTGEIHCCNGGHNPPYILLDGGKIQRFNGKGGLALGVDESAVYKTTIISETCGVILYSDGVTEAESKEGKYFSETKLVEILKKEVLFSSREIIDTVLEEVRKFSLDAPQSDDITMLAIKYSGEGGRAEN